jgi:PAS domain S-box-containing protein
MVVGARAPARPVQRSLRRLVVGAGLAMALTVCAVLASVVAYEYRHQVDGTTERNVLLARVFADSVTRNLEAASQATASLTALLGQGVLPDSPEMRASLSQLLVNLPFLRGVGIVNAQGTVLGGGAPGEIGRMVDMSVFGALPVQEREVLGYFTRGRGLTDAGAAQSPNGVGYLPLVRVVTVDGGSTLAVIAMINVQAFINYQQVTLGDGDVAAALLSYDGRFIAGTSGVAREVDADLTALPPFSQFLPQHEFGHWTGPGLRDGEQMGAFRVSATRPVVVLVEHARSAALAVWVRLTASLALAGAAAMLVIAGATRLALRSVTAREGAQSERDTAQRAVAQRERELRITIRSLQELIFRTDAAGALTFVNDRWIALTGTETSKAMGAYLWDLVVPEEREGARALFDSAESTSIRRAQLHVRDPSGTLRSFEIAVMPLMFERAVVGFAGSAVDVTERSVAQDRLRAQLAFNELMMDNSPLPMSVVDLAGRYVRVNRAWEEFNGRKREDVIGQPVGAHLSPEERIQHQVRDHALLGTREPQRYEARAMHADGNLRDVLISKVLLPPEQGVAGGVLSVLTDVTDFRRAERATREARDAAEEASRAKSEFIANISHELRTPLQGIIGFSELGQMRGREQPKLAGMFSDIHASGHRMLSLVNDLLDVSKIESTVGSIHLERADLRGILRELLREMEPLLRSRRQAVDLVLPEHALMAKVDPMRIQQVLRNVMANAIKFSPEGSRIRVVGDYDMDLQPCLAIHDQGPGVPPGELEAIFDAFVQSSRTKDGSGGTGLGLAICRKIVAAHGGHIHAENAPGGGAVFHIVLPARGSSETQPMEL